MSHNYFNHYTTYIYIYRERGWGYITIIEILFLSHFMSNYL